MLKPYKCYYLYSPLFFKYLNWQMSGCDFITVNWQLPVASYGSGWFGFTKYVPLSRTMPPHDAITFGISIKPHSLNQWLINMYSNQRTNATHSISFGARTTGNSTACRTLIIRHTTAIFTGRCLAQWLAPLNNREQWQNYLNIELYNYYL